MSNTGRIEPMTARRGVLPADGVPTETDGNATTSVAQDTPEQTPFGNRTGNETATASRGEKSQAAATAAELVQLRKTREAWRKAYAEKHDARFVTLKDRNGRGDIISKRREFRRLVAEKHGVTSGRQWVRFRRTLRRQVRAQGAGA